MNIINFKTQILKFCDITIEAFNLNKMQSFDTNLRILNEIVIILQLLRNISEINYLVYVLSFKS